MTFKAKVNDQSLFLGLHSMLSIGYVRIGILLACGFRILVMEAKVAVLVARVRAQADLHLERSPSA